MFENYNVTVDDCNHIFSTNESIQQNNLHKTKQEFKILKKKKISKKQQEQKHNSIKKMKEMIIKKIFNKPSKQVKKTFPGNSIAKAMGLQNVHNTLKILKNQARRQINFRQMSKSQKKKKTWRKKFQVIRTLCQLNVITLNKKEREKRTKTFQQVQ